MFIVVFTINRFAKDTWLMLLVEILVGAVIYVTMVYILKASIIDEVKGVLIKKLKK